MKAKLSRDTKRVLKKASRHGVESSLSLLKRGFKSSQWLRAGNRYRVNTIERLRADSKTGRHINNLHLRKYIAASAPLHCADGWAILGRALDCHSRGDYDSSRHLAYYAELRAAFSVLAVEGIAIFNRKNFAVDAAGRCLPFSGPTHEIVWQALDYWAGLKRSAELLGSVIRVHGIPLTEWLSYFPSGGSLRAVGGKWLKTWGLDLRVFFDDREVRNESSYRPTQITRRSPLDVADSVDFVCALWSVFEPAAQTRFEKLDRHLLRLSLEEIFLATRGRPVSGSRSQFEKAVEATLSRALPDSAAHGQWLGFLTRGSEAQNSVILSEAVRTDPISEPRQHLQVISRAALLLRVATGANSLMLKEVGISGDELSFWWSALGEQRGLWDGSNQPENLSDLWADAETAIDGIKAWNTKTPTADKTLFQWRQANSHNISVLGGCERIALWGLGL